MTTSKGRITQVTGAVVDVQFEGVLPSILNALTTINRLTLNYNRSRQAYITKELIEIISGAEAI